MERDVQKSICWHVNAPLLNYWSLRHLAFFMQPTYTDVYTAYSEHILHFAYDSMTGSYDLPSAFAHVFAHFQGVTNHWMKWREPVATEMIEGYWECSQTTSQKIFCQELTGLKIVGQDWSNKFTLLTFLCFHQFWRSQCSRCKGVQCWRICFLSYDYVSADSLNCPREAIMRPWPEMGRQTAQLVFFSLHFCDRLIHPRSSQSLSVIPEWSYSSGLSAHSQS